MKKPLVTSGRRLIPWRIFIRGVFPAHRTGAHAPAQGTLAFSSPGCHVLSLTGPFLMLKTVNQKGRVKSRTICVIKSGQLAGIAWVPRPADTSGDLPPQIMRGRD